MPKTLTKTALKKATVQFPDWKLSSDGKQAVLTLVFKKHVEALAFLARITVHAEVLAHHPDVLFTHAKLKITTTTHEAKGLTEKDLALMERIDALLKRSGG